MDKKNAKLLEKARKKLEEVSLELFEVRLDAEGEPYDTVMLDTARNSLDSVIQIITALCGK